MMLSATVSPHMDKQRIDQDPARPAALAALGEGDIAAVVGAGAPALVFANDPPRLVHANAAAMKLFDIGDEQSLALRAAAGGDAVFTRLLQLNKSLRPGAPARSERLRCEGPHAGQVAFNIRRISGNPPLLIAMAPDLTGLAPPEEPAAHVFEAPPVPEPELVEAAAQPPQPQGARNPADVPQDVAHDLAQRYDGAPFVRFLWQTDATDRLSSLTGPLCEIVGCDRSAALGQDFVGFVTAAGADADQRLAGTFSKRETWSNLELTWPISGAPAAISVVLGGLPTFDGARSFDGYRGFGVVHLQKVTPYAAPPVIEAPEPEAPEAEATTDTAEDVATLQEPVPTPAPAPAAAPAPTTNVVPLRPNRAAPTPAPVAPAPAEPAAPKAPRTSSMIELSASERNAFREIAKALGAKGEDAEPPARARAELRVPDSKPPKIEEPPQPMPAVTEAVPVEAAPQNPRARDLIEIASRARGIADDLARQSEPAAEDEDDGQGVLNLEIGAADEVEAELAEHLPATGATPDPFDESLGRHARSVIDRLPIGVLISRLEIPIFLNKTLLDLLGYESADEFHEAGGLEQMFRGRSPESLADAASGGAIPLVTHSGEMLAAETRVQSIKWDGDPATMICLRPSRDGEVLAKLRTAEQDLRGRDTEIRELHAILDTATDGVVLIDEEGRLLSINRAAQALFGCEPTELVGAPFTSLLARESHLIANDYLSGLRTAGVASVMNDGREVTGRARQGGSIPLFMTIGRVNAGGTNKFCAVLRDLTSWKKAELELNEARKQAERASALKSDFLAKVSHEIRTPLNAILGFAEVITGERFGPIGNERYKDYLKDIHASGTHVMSLVNDLLDLSKIEAGRLELNFGAVDANKIVSECVSLMQPQAARERVIIRLSLAQRLPNIVADERSLRQIVLNLLSNAVKFNEPGGQVIVSTALTDAGHAVIRIRDTGIGMTDAEAQLALEPFRQLATARVSGGTGLGLPLTKALVEANRASFTIKSKKKEGTLIEVAFPPTRVLAE